MLTITGNTYEHREFLKALRARYDGARKCWIIDRSLAPAILATLKQLPGITVSDSAPKPAPPPPRPSVTYVQAEPKPRPENPRTIVVGDSTWLHHFARKDASMHFGFSSLAEQIDYCRAIPHHVSRDERHTAWLTHEKYVKFCGTPNYASALYMAEYGSWSEGIEKATEIIEHFNIAHAQQRRRKHTLAGGHVNVGRMLAGNPAHMVSRPRRDGRKVITLFVDSNMSASIRRETAIIRAALIAALADLLEREGYSCEIIMSDLVMHWDDCIYSMTTCIKRAGEKFSLGDLVFALGHPSYLRRIIFSIVASRTELQSIWEGMGAPHPLFDNVVKPAKNELFISHVDASAQAFLNGDLIDRAKQMLPWIIPNNFPIEVKQ